MKEGKRKAMDSQIEGKSKKNIFKNNDASNIPNKKLKKGKQLRIEKSTLNAKTDSASKKKSQIFIKEKKNIKHDKNKQNLNSESVKPDWVEMKKKQKELRETRKVKKLTDSYEIIIKAKKIGEQLRLSKISVESKQKLTTKLHDVVQGHYEKMIFSHDMSRVVQWQIKYCSSEMRDAIVEELKPQLLQMFFSKYAKNIIRTILKTGSDSVKKFITESCFGNVTKLLSSVVSAPLFEKVYVEFASDPIKIKFKQEFFGDMYKKTKDPNIKNLADSFKADAAMKQATLSSVKAHLVRILNKNLINSTLVHTVLNEYFQNCSKVDRAEMIVMVRNLITELSQTKEGAKAANICIWHGTNKDRKLIMKTVKEHVKDIVMSEHGYLMILALLDSVDDTVLLKKILLTELFNNLTEIASNEYGKRVILYLVARRNTHYFHPALINYLKEGDENETSKKPAETREKELLESVLNEFLQSITSDAKAWLSNGSMQIITLAILQASHGDKPAAAFKAISALITNSSVKLQKDDKSIEIIEEPGLHMILKKIAQMDRQRVEKTETTFGETLMKDLTQEVIEYWINYNRGCFFIVTLIENESPQIVAELKGIVQKTKKTLELKNSKGATILLKKLVSNE